MNLIEALKTGRALRRKRWSLSAFTNRECVANNLSVDDILSDDWEVEPAPEKKIELTITKFNEAVRRVFEDDYVRWPTDITARLQKELGLE